jgi:hypothetical protein
MEEIIENLKKRVKSIPIYENRISELMQEKENLLI